MPRKMYPFAARFNQGQPLYDNSAFLWSTLTKPSRRFTIPSPCFLPLCLVGGHEIPSGSHKGIKQMGRCQTETYYRTDTSYLKSVVLWLQEYWSGPTIQVRPIKTARQASRHVSVRRPLASPNRRGEIIDVPAFLPPRRLSQYRQ